MLVPDLAVKEFLRREDRGIPCLPDDRRQVNG
jgi:hypothetical protein